MKTGFMGLAKWVALAVFVLVAGFCYSCGLGGQTAGLSHAEGLVREPEASGIQGSDAVVSGTGQPGASGTGTGAGEPGVSGAGTGNAEVAGIGAGLKEAKMGLAGADSAEDNDTEAVPAATCFVHVCGEVARPGVYELAEGQRVFEAVKLAGGFTEAAADSFLNLAEPVRDGMKIQVPDKNMVPDEMLTGIQSGGMLSGGIKPSGNESAGDTHKKVNINTATKEELMTLRGIGEARAEDIIRYRQQRGGFGSIEDIMKVSGIKDAAFQKIKDDITV